VVAILTGNGLKDPDTAAAGAGAPLEIDAEVGVLREALS
jgi:threonine synthase